MGVWLERMQETAVTYTQQVLKSFPFCFLPNTNLCNIQFGCRVSVIDNSQMVTQHGYEIRPSWGREFVFYKPLSFCTFSDPCLSMGSLHCWPLHGGGSLRGAGEAYSQVLQYESPAQVFHVPLAWLLRSCSQLSGQLCSPSTAGVFKQ